MILTVDPGRAGERHERRISALLWSSDADPTLMAAESFRTAGELRDWLAEWDRRHPTEIKVRWSDALRSSPSLVQVIAEVLGQVPPRQGMPA